MIAEWLTSLRIPCARPIRDMGFHKELVALTYRYKRQHRHWQSHLQKTRDVILAAMDKCLEKDVLLVLGAGSLLDIPLVQLCGQFNQVYLVDIVFLPSTRKAVKLYRNCKFKTSDITGTLRPVHDFARGLKGQQVKFDALPRPKDPTELSEVTPSLTLSVNILSQLPLLPLQYLERQSIGHLKEERPPLAGYCHDVVAHHLTWLKSLPGQICLISDEKRGFYRPKTRRPEEIDGEQDALYGYVLPKGGEQWHWEIAPPGEQEKHLGIRHLVRGYTDF